MKNEQMTLREMIEIGNTDNSLTFALGKNDLDEAVFCDLSKMPHLIIGGEICRERNNDV